MLQGIVVATFRLFGEHYIALTFLAFAFSCFRIFFKVFVEPRLVFRAVESLPGPKSSFILGNLHQIGLGPALLPNICQIMNDLKSNFRLWFGPRPMVVVCNPTDVARILKTSEPKGFVYDLLRPWLGQGLLTNAGEEWRTMRHLLTPAFHFDILRDYFAVMPEHIDVLCRKLDEVARRGQDVDLFSFITLLTLDVVSECAMGVRLSAQLQPDQPYVRAVSDFTQGVMYRLYNPWLLSNLVYGLSAAGRRQQAALRTLHKVSRSVIAQRAAAGTSRGRRDFLSILLETRFDDGRPLPAEKIREEVDTFLFEGHDTTAAGLTWTLFELARHPACADRIAAEAERVLGAGGSGEGRGPQYGDLARLEYTAACVKEAMRLYPPVPAISRAMTAPFQLEGVTLPVGTEVVVCPYLVHRFPGVWDQPETFQPERFLKGGAADRLRGENPYVYVPFSAGPRNCIGQKFAEMEELLTVATLCRRFRFHLVQESDCQPNMELILRPVRGIRVRVERRL